MVFGSPAGRTATLRFASRGQLLESSRLQQERQAGEEAGEPCGVKGGWRGGPAAWGLRHLQGTAVPGCVGWDGEEEAGGRAASRVGGGGSLVHGAWVPCGSRTCGGLGGLAFGRARALGLSRPAVLPRAVRWDHSLPVSGSMGVHAAHGSTFSAAHQPHAMPLLVEAPNDLRGPGVASSRAMPPVLTRCPQGTASILTVPLLFPLAAWVHEHKAARPGNDELQRQVRWAWGMGRGHRGTVGKAG